LYCGIDYQGQALEWSRVNQHPYLYLHFLELSLLVIIFWGPAHFIVKDFDTVSLHNQGPHMNNFGIYFHGTTFGCVMKTLSAFPWSHPSQYSKGYLNPGNVKFDLRDLGFSLRMRYLPWFEST